MPEAIILAGGFGQRLRPIISEVPKPMAPIAGRPFLEILLNALIEKGITRIILSLGYKADAITSHFGTTYRDKEISTVVEKKPLGTGGAVRFALDKCREECAFVCNGDTLIELDILAAFREWHIDRTPRIVGRMVEDTGRFGRLKVEKGRLAGFTEKGMNGPGLISCGCYLFGKDQLHSFPVNKRFSLEQDYLAHLAPGSLKVIETHGTFIDIGVPADFFRAQKLLEERYL